jgi:hypothetical protein
MPIAMHGHHFHPGTTMQARFKLIVAVAAALTGVAGAQTTSNTPNSTRSAGEVARDSANAVGRAASAAVTPGDQDMGRNPGNRSGGLMGNDQGTPGAAGAVGRAASAAVTPGDQNMGRNPDNRSGGLMGNERGGAGTDANGRRTTARADRG